VRQGLSQPSQATAPGARLGLDLRPSAGVSPARRDSAPSGPDDRFGSLWLPFGLAAISFLGYALYSILQYRRAGEPSWDLAIFTQIVKGYAHFHAPVEQLRGAHLDALGDHFSPILATLAPIYRIFPSPLTLQIAQAALFAVAVVPITRLAIQKLGHRAGAAIGVSYSLAWGIQAAIGVDFHEVAFAVPLLAFSVTALVNQQWRRATLWALPLLLVKEDMGLTVAAIGLYMLICHQRRRGLALMAGGVLAVAVTIGVIIPALNPTHHYMYWGMLGSSHSATPWSLIAHLVAPWTKLHTTLLLIGVAGFIALRSPLAVLCLPTLLWRFESTNPAYWGTDWHYNAVLMPILFAAMIDGIVRARRSDRTWARSLADHAPALSLGVSVVLCLQFPLHAIAQSRSYHSSPPGAAAAMALIPAGSTVETNLVGVMAPLVPTHTVYSIGYDMSVIPDYVIAQTSVTGSSSDPATVRSVDSLHPGTTYQLIFHQGIYEVLRKVSAP
jgi:uncharacterized membrane protein